MFLLLEAAFVAISLAAFALWACAKPESDRGRRLQMVALLAAIVLLYPSISLADDLRDQQQPIDLPTGASSLVKHVPAALSAAPAALPAAPYRFAGACESFIGIATNSLGHIGPRPNAVLWGLRAPPQS